MDVEKVNCDECSELTAKPIVWGEQLICWFCYDQLVECDACARLFHPDDMRRMDEGDFCERCCE